MAPGARDAATAERDAGSTPMRKQLGKVVVFSLSSTALIAIHLRRADPLFLGQVFAFVAALSVVGLLAVQLGARVGA
ncbi:hypothetical protein ACFR9U_06705 [Halorientalis brevis]|uniref:Uncharacterized protein n=1 Tax=Halorientalis brevis TaxID=1126241 RepID=A0ABD6C8N0_9EURY|nr:hypothetical protein [Halorientalis brevis]